MKGFVISHINCSDVEMIREIKGMFIKKGISNSQLNLKPKKNILEQYFLTVSKNNFGNKIPFPTKCV